MFEATVRPVKSIVDSVNVVATVYVPIKAFQLELSVEYRTMNLLAPSALLKCEKTKLDKSIL